MVCYLSTFKFQSGDFNF
uniref:Uncharacterized protein n=1 Tax=Arundo donax TaxID=35708 RepID=A0A0A9A314_ARUDO